MPKGLWHAPTREGGGKDGTRQYKKLARRFVLWRQRDMEGLIRTWKQVSIKARNRVSSREARNSKTDMARIDKAMRLLRKGTLSRAMKAMECKGLGQLNDPELIWQMHGKCEFRDG